MIKISLQQKLINTLLFISLGILVGSNLLVYRQIQELISSNAILVHTHKVVETANQLGFTLSDAEFHSYLYVTTDIDKNKNITNTDFNLTKIKFNELKNLVSDNPAQTERINELAPLIAKKISQINQIDLSHHKNMGKEEIKKFSVDLQKNNEKDEITALLAKFNEQEIKLLKSRSDDFYFHVMKGNQIFLITTGLSLFLLVFSIVLLNYHLTKRNLDEKKQVSMEQDLLKSNRLLKESEERYHLATTGSNSGLWDWEIGKHDIYLSPYLKSMLGYRDDELPNTTDSFTNNLYPDDEKKAIDLLKEHIQRHVPYSYECRLRTKSGEYRWFQVVGQATWNEQGFATRMAGSVVDVTEKKKAESSLAMQYAVGTILSEVSTLEEGINKITKYICIELNRDVGIFWLLDKRNQYMRCMDIYQANPNINKKFLVESRRAKFKKNEDYIGQLWKSAQPNWLHDLATQFRYAQIKEANLAGLKSVSSFPIMLNNDVLAVLQLFSKDRLIIDYNVIRLISSIGLNIALFINRQWTDDEIRENEAYKTAILEYASDCIITVDLDGSIVSYNTKTTTTFGYSTSELESINVNKIMPNLLSRLEPDSGKPAFEFIGEQKDGKQFPIEIAISKMHVGDRLSYVLLVRDITDRKRIEKLKTEFISMVSHELRTPLTSIRGSLGLMVSGAVGSFPEKANRLLDIANKNSERLLFLINDILDLEKIEAGKMIFNNQVVDIKEIVQNSIEANKSYGEKYGVSIKLLEPFANVKVDVDPDRLMQVLANLISNAVKFSYKGEVVEIGVQILFETGQVRVFVINIGPAIPKDFHERVFEKFSQADSSNTRGKGGTGLGLSISKAIIEKMHGSLGFQSENDKTTFYFDLPFDKNFNLNLVTNDSNEIQNDSIDKINLLICEDDEDQAKYLQAMLGGRGFHADCAFSAGEAKKLLDKDNNYRVLLLDLILPDQDGIALIKELRKKEKTKQLPIIVMSVIAQTGKTLLNNDTFTVPDWFDKPINIDKLINTIKHIVETH